jgi:hypothetical protein
MQSHGTPASMGEAHSRSRRPTKETDAVTNKHNFGKAPAAAIMLETMRGSEKMEVPDVLLETYRKELEPTLASDGSGRGRFWLRSGDRRDGGRGDLD